MKNKGIFTGLLCSCIIFLGTNFSLGQSGGWIVGWGTQSIVEPTAHEDLVAVASGLNHSLGLKSDGSIVAWGSNISGECNVPEPNAGFVAVAGGGIHSLGLRFDGSVVAWGWNSSGQCNIPEPNADFISVAGGGAHSLGLKSDGTIVAWGLNDTGQCTIPEPNADFVSIACGYNHSLGLKSDGSIVAWGLNEEDQCTVPDPNADFVAVTGGRSHSLGLKSDGSIVAWGGAAYGLCNVPEPNADFMAIHCGWFHNLGLKTDGSIVAWGLNNFGQCTVPEPNAGFVAIGGGNSHNLALKTDHSLVAWGRNSEGQCITPGLNTEFVAVKGGGTHGLGLKFDGSLVAWGGEHYGQCNIPEPNSGFVAIACGEFHSLGLKSDSSVVVWGLGTEPEPNVDFVKVASGGYHNLGLKSDGSIVVWGNNHYQINEVPEPNADFVALAGGGYHSLGLKSDGSVVAWGRNNYGQLNVPEPNVEFIAVACGTYHSLGLKSDGSIVAWGCNHDGQCNVPEPNSDFVKIAGGGYHNLGLKSDDSIVGWGLNGYGQCNVPSPNIGYKDIAAGGYHSLGIRSPDNTQSLTITPNHAFTIPCIGPVTLNFNYTPTVDPPAVKGYSVRIVAHPQVSFSASDFQVNTLPQGEQVFFQVVENAPNDFTLDYAILGSGTFGITTPETLFSIIFHGVGEGSAVVSVASANFRDLDNNSIPVNNFTHATITVDCTPPAAVSTALVAPGHEQTTVTWSDPVDFGLVSVLVMRGLWHDGELESAYPGYGLTAGNTLPAQFETHAEYFDSPEWELVGTVGAGVSTFTDVVSPRGIYYYQLFAVDNSDNISGPLVESPSATNYLLGDVANPYDGEVDILDLSLLGASYGVACGHQYYNDEADVGPTHNGNSHGLPVPDCLVGFEDLMIFGFNFGGDSGAKNSAPGCGELNISWLQQGELEWSCVLRQPCPSLKGLHLVAGGPGLKDAQVERGALLSEQSGQVFLQKASSSLLDVGLVVLGAGRGVEGAGELFRVILTAPVAYLNPSIEARDTANQILVVQLMDPVAAPVPTRFSLEHNFPNPFNPSTTIGYSLPEARDVNLSIYSVDGRLVRTLVAEVQPAGIYEVVWDGKNEQGKKVSSGVYFSRVKAGSYHAMDKMVLMK